MAGGQVNMPEILANCQVPNDEIRNHAEKMLTDMRNSNLGAFVSLLAQELCVEGKNVQLRQLAGLQLKNTLDAQDEALAQQRADAWLSVAPEIRAKVKHGVLTTLQSPDHKAAHTCAQVIAKIARIEFPAGKWNELVPTLLQNVQQEANDGLVQSSLQSLGYFCEEVDADSIQQTVVDQILTAIVQGTKRQKSKDIVHAGAMAMLHALDFVHANFTKKQERDAIMSAIMTTSLNHEEKVRVVAYECIGQVASLYYEHLRDYMQDLFKMTFNTVRTDSPTVGMQALEFWSTLCDTELGIIDMKENGEETIACAHYIKGALHPLVELLTETLTKQDDVQDDDTWNIAMAGGTCLSLAAQVVRDDIVPKITPFIHRNIRDPNWRKREAAMLAFGSIMEGPDERTLGPMVEQALPLLLNLMKTDTDSRVKDTTAWTIGRICGLHIGAVKPGMWPELMHVLMHSQNDEPRVAANICFACNNLAQSMEEFSDNEGSNALSPYFKGLVEKLLSTADRDDWDINNLRVSAYEAVNMLVSSAAEDMKPLIKELVPYFCGKLNDSLNFKIVTTDDKDEHYQLQALLCGTIQTAINRLDDEIKSQADTIMKLLLRVFSCNSATAHEEAYMAIGALANAVEQDFDRYMNVFVPFLKRGLERHDEHQVCVVAAGVVGDVTRALEQKVTPYCKDIMALLIQNLQNSNLDRAVKPPILGVFGDIALAIGGDFNFFLPVVMTMLHQAGKIPTPDDADEDMVEYIATLRENILDAYAGIIQGMHEGNQAAMLAPFADQIGQFLGTVSMDPQRDDATSRSIAGVLGDLAMSLGSRVKPIVTHQFAQGVLGDCKNSPNEDTREMGKWATTKILEL